MDKTLFRPGTSDENIYRSMVDANEYKLPEAFEPADLIVDVGAHCGFFAHACIQRGAGRVVCFEPDPDNYSLLRQHLSAEIAERRVEAFPVAVTDELGFRTFSGVVRTDGEINHGGAFLFGGNEDSYGLDEYIVNRPFTVLTIPFDMILDGVPGNFHPRLVKLDCEKSEHEIIRSASLAKFPQIVGEYHPSGEHSGETLKTQLEKLGFSVGLFPWKNSDLGLFFARK